MYLAQGDFGTDTETKRQVISAMLTVPQVKSDQHQWSATVGSRQRSSYVEVLEQATLLNQPHETEGDKQAFVYKIDL